VAQLTAAEEVRAVIEGQFLSMRYHSNNIGISHFKSILATGGASKNKSITQVIADVFGVPVYTAQTANSAALGAAYRAMHGAKCAAEKHFVPLGTVLSRASPFMKIAEPNMRAHEVYKDVICLRLVGEESCGVCVVV
jgi:sugar (pentulose or hexulose) kinase